MKEYYKKQREDSNYMFVKVLGVIPYFEDSNVSGVEVPNDGCVYFEVISNHFLRGMILKMDKFDFHEIFTNERSRYDSNMKIENQGSIFSSREWVFYEKVMWWNNNIKAVLDCSCRNELEFVTLYNDYVEQYCHEFNTDTHTFMKDKNFFDDLLTEIYVDKSGSIQSKKERMNKPKARKYCSICGNSVRQYVVLPNKNIMCKMCEEQIDTYEYLRFEKQWEQDRE